MNIASIIRGLSGKTIVLVKTDTKTTNVDFEKNMENLFNRDVVVKIYNKKLSVGFDFSEYDNIIYYNFKHSFFETTEGKQLHGRFNRHPKLKDKNYITISVE